MTFPLAARVLDVNAATMLHTMLDAHTVRSGCALAGMVRALELGRVPGWKELRVGAQDVDYAYSSLRYKKKKKRLNILFHSSRSGYNFVL